MITASAGNHALALAYYGMKLGVPVTVVLPTTAPQVKVSILCSDIHIVMRFIFSKMTARVDNLYSECEHLVFCDVCGGAYIFVVALTFLC